MCCCAVQIFFQNLVANRSWKPSVATTIIGSIMRRHSADPMGALKQDPAMYACLVLSRRKSAWCHLAAVLLNALLTSFDYFIPGSVLHPQSGLRFLMMEQVLEQLNVEDRDRWYETFSGDFAVPSNLLPCHPNPSLHHCRVDRFRFRIQFQRAQHTGSTKPADRFCVSARLSRAATFVSLSNAQKDGHTGLPHAELLLQAKRMYDTLRQLL